MSEITSSTYAANLALYEKVLAAVPGVERKGDTVPYTSRNGHMFSYLSKQGVSDVHRPSQRHARTVKCHRTLEHRHLASTRGLLRWP
jgi:hypothetical protein